MKVVRRLFRVSLIALAVVGLWLLSSCLIKEIFHRFSTAPLLDTTIPDRYDGPSVIPFSDWELGFSLEPLISAVYNNYVTLFHLGYPYHPPNLYLYKYRVWPSPFLGPGALKDFSGIGGFQTELLERGDGLRDIVISEIKSEFGEEVHGNGYDRFILTDKNRMGLTMYVSPIFVDNGNQIYIGIGHKLIDGAGLVADGRFVVYKVEQMESPNHGNLIPVSVVTVYHTGRSVTEGSNVQGMSEEVGAQPFGGKAEP